jgi:hypothetical protein
MTTATRRDLLTHVLDTLVPATNEFPVAGSAALDHVLGMACASTEVDALLCRALDLVEGAARSTAADFAALDVDGRERVLRLAEATDGLTFDALVRHAYDGYYSHPAVLTRLGLEPGPLHPHGHRVEEVEIPDELARAAARRTIYRQA